VTEPEQPPRTPYEDVPLRWWAVFLVGPLVLMGMTTTATMLVSAVGLFGLLICLSVGYTREQL